MHQGNPFTEQTLGKYFVGRDEELITFLQNLEGLADSSPSHAFVAGMHGTGKSSFLDKLVIEAKQANFVGVLTSLDDKASAIASIAKILRAVIDTLQKTYEPDSKALIDDWDRGRSSTIFRQPKLESIDSDAIRHDIQKALQIAGDHGSKGIVLCIDEGQRMQPSALSSLKNALQPESGILLVLSLRLTTAEIGARRAGRVLLDKIANDAEGDIGASRFFVTEFGMGPFANDEEAHRCITTRLEDNVVSFDFDVIRGISELSEHIPRNIITYAHKVWNLAHLQHPPRANEDTLAQVIRETHPAETDRAQLLVARLSGLKRKVLDSLLQAGGTASTEQLVNRLHNGEQDNVELLTRVVPSELDDLVPEFSGLQRMDDHFTIPHAIDRFTLRIALEEQ